jgi:peroxiredoxin
MENNKAESREKLIDLVRKAIELLAEKNISNVVILSSYKINSVLRDNYGVNLKVDKIGRVLSKIAKINELKRLNTNIPKYKLQISKVSSLQFF